MLHPSSLQGPPAVSALPSPALLPQVRDSRCQDASERDDNDVRSVSRWIGALGAVLCVLASVVMCVAAYLPYTGGNWGDGLPTGNEVSTQVTVNIVSGSDVWLVLGTVITLGFVAALHLGGARRQFTGLIALVASLVALGLALKLPGTWQQADIEVVPGEPYLLFAGFYVFLGGAVTAVFGALLMVAGGLLGVSLKAEPLLPTSPPRPTAAS
jgi:hypothetical protein